MMMLMMMTMTMTTATTMMMMRMLMLMLMLMLMAMNWPQSYHIIAVATNQNRPLYCIIDPCTWHVAAWKACVGNDLRPHGCGKPVAAMACGRWLWKACSCMKAITPARACGCNGLWPLVVESL